MLDAVAESGLRRATKMLATKGRQRTSLKYCSSLWSASRYDCLGIGRSEIRPQRGLRVVLAYLLYALQVLHPTLLPFQRQQEGDQVVQLRLR